MSSNLNVVLVQYDITWHDEDSNFSIIEKLLADIEEQPDLIVLPEAFCCGFTNEPNKLGNINTKVSRWMKELASNFNAIVMGSFPYFFRSSYFNRLLSVHPEGKTESYDKRHLFSLTGEDKNYKAGKQQNVFSAGNWKISPAICYDIRFPVWCRNTVGYDLLVAVANWPAARDAAWEALLRARSIENQSYVVGVNRVGEDKQGTKYLGNSLIFSPEGDKIGGYQNNESGLIQASLSLKNLNDLRTKFPFLNDQDRFKML